ncbi:MAG: aldehyde dehydrogenase [Mycobacterium sp.]|nr:aldehyde dehydrogenase [Mycobacterium sp.]
MVYGGQDMVDKYANDLTVFPNGPGRSKILITAEKAWRDYLDVIVDSISDMGGMACVNTTAVLCEGDPAPLAQAIAERLSTIPPLPTFHERPSCPLSRSTRRKRWRRIWQPTQPAPPRCWVPIRWSLTSATATRRCAQQCTC